MANIFSVFGTILVDNTKANKSIDDTTEKAKESSKGVSDWLSAIGKGALAIGAAAGTAALAIGGKAATAANDADRAMRGFAAGTDVSNEKLKDYEGTLKNIYANNYGESFEDIADKMKLTTEQMGELSSQDLQSVVESGYLLQDTFDIDFSESLRGANALMKQFGVDAETAYNLIAQGAQNGLNQNGDLADQLAEYSVYYSDLGFTAEETMNIIANGAKDGTFQIDYLNDAMKEFGIRSKDGSDSSRAAFEYLGYDADKLFKTFSEGGEEAAAMTQIIIDELTSMPDSVEKTTAGVALFGTKWEDLGATAIAALSSTDGSIEATKNSLAEIEEVKYGDLTSMFEGLSRTIEVLIIPLGKKFIPLLKNIIEKLLPVLQTVLQPVIESIAGIIEPLLQLVESLLPTAIEFIQSLLPPLLEIVQLVLPVIVDLIQLLMPPIMQIIQMLLPLLINLITPLLPLLQPIFQLLQPFIDLFLNLLEPLTQLLNMILPPLISLVSKIISVAIVPLQAALEMLASIIGSVVTTAFDNIKVKIETVKTVFSNIIDFIKNVFYGNWSAAWENVKNIFISIFDGFKERVGNIFNGFIEVIKAPVNAVIKIINKLIEAVNSVSFEIPDWVPEWGGKTFGLNLKPIQLLAKGTIVDEPTPAIVGEDGAEAVIPLEKNTEWINRLASDLNSKMGSDADSIAILKEILAEIKALRRELFDIIVSALVDGVSVEWKERELMRLIKAYAS